ncbi:DUF190 domain-containing protein [Alicyclobacillus suci]|uniref:DUF190 domain-containing protein n=1 Tax=Alicyclobacillus suci TaxID=2816080 RepID=UPI001A8DC41D|nr:DUF190 domain-containing protein [Alicyclobacillus suci]
MSQGVLLTIRLYESDRKKWYSRIAYEEIVRHLWAAGAPGVTVFRDVEGLDARGHIETVYNDYVTTIPITMEVYGTPEEIDGVCKLVSSELFQSSRLFVNRDVRDLKQKESMEELRMTSGYVLKVYMKEEDHYHHTPLYHALLETLKKQNVMWVDVQHALEGFGADHVIRKTSLLSFSEHAPIVLEAALNGDVAGDVLEQIKPLLAYASGPAILLNGEILSPDVQSCVDDSDK